MNHRTPPNRARHGRRHAYTALRDEMGRVSAAYNAALAAGDMATARLGIERMTTMTSTPTLTATAVDDLLTPAIAAAESAEQTWTTLPARALQVSLGRQRAALGRRQAGISDARHALQTEHLQLALAVEDAALLGELGVPVPAEASPAALQAHEAAIAPRLSALDHESAELTAALALLAEREVAGDLQIQEASRELVEARRALDQARRRQPLLDLRGLVRDLLDVRAPFRLQDVVSEDGSLTTYIAAKVGGVVYRIAGADGFKAYRAAYPALPDAMMERRPRNLYGPARELALADGLIQIAEVLEVLERVHDVAVIKAIHWTGSYDRGDERYRVHLLAGPTAAACETLAEARAVVG